MNARTKNDNVAEAEEQVDLPESPDAHPVSKNPVNAALLKFLDGIYAVQKTLVVIMPHVDDWLKNENVRVKKAVEKMFKHESKDGDLVLSAKDAASFMQVIRDFNEFSSVDHHQVISQSLFTQIFCEFDAFMGALLKALYESKPELMAGLDRKISLAELTAYDTIQSATSVLIDEEIDSFRRSSYVDQFNLLETRFGVPLKKFAEWSEFVELGQRRNILIHNGGIVSGQYRVVCARENLPKEKTASLGEKLSIEPAYLARALLIMRKVAFMLTHTLWRKLLPDQMESAHTAGHLTIYNLLLKKMWNTAGELGEFLLSPINCKGVDEVARRMRIINSAIGYKFSKKDAECARILDSEDWTATYRDFKLAVAILRGEEETVWQIMRQIGKRGEMLDELSYYEWPLFHELRSQTKFQEVFMEIYEHPFFSNIAHTMADGTIVGEAANAVVSLSTAVQKPSRRKSTTVRQKSVTNGATMNPSSLPSNAKTSAKRTAKAETQTTKKKQQ